MLYFAFVIIYFVYFTLNYVKNHVCTQIFNEDSRFIADQYYTKGELRRNRNQVISGALCQI